MPMVKYNSTTFTWNCFCYSVCDVIQRWKWIKLHICVIHWATLLSSFTGSDVRSVIICYDIVCVCIEYFNVRDYMNTITITNVLLLLLLLNVEIIAHFTEAFVMIYTYIYIYIRHILHIHRDFPTFVWFSSHFFSVKIAMYDRK